jgi:hypothetical protein
MGKQGLAQAGQNSVGCRGKSVEWPIQRAEGKAKQEKIYQPQRTQSKIPKDFLSSSA